MDDCKQLPPPRILLFCPDKIQISRVVVLHLLMSGYLLSNATLGPAIHSAYSLACGRCILTVCRRDAQIGPHAQYTVLPFSVANRLRRRAPACVLSFPLADASLSAFCWHPRREQRKTSPCFASKTQNVRRPGMSFNTFRKPHLTYFNKCTPYHRQNMDHRSRVAPNTRARIRGV